MNTFDKDKLIITNLVKAIKNAVPDNISNVYWIGSRARREGYSDSDFDLLVVSSQEISPGDRDKITDIVIDFEAEEEVVFDLHYFPEKDIDKLPGRSPFIAETLEKGILV